MNEQTHMMRVLLTKKQWEELKQLCECAGCNTVSEYIRKRIFQDPEYTVMIRDIHKKICLQR